MTLRITLAPWFLAASALALGCLMCAGCATAPTVTQTATATVAGATVATTVARTSPQAALYLQTAAAAVRSVSGVTAPTPEQLAATLQQWTAAIPALNAEVPKILAAYQTHVYPTAARASNALAILEDFAAGISAASAAPAAPAPRG